MPIIPTITPSTPDAFLICLESAQLQSFFQLVELLGKQHRTLTDCRACGEHIAALRPADAGYGSGWVKEICEALARQEVTLSLSLGYRFLRFAEQYPGTKGKEQVRRLEGRVSWESMLRIIHVDDVETRNAILERAADEELSSRDVIALIREKTAYRRARGGRAKSKPSSHPNRALKDLRVLSSKWQAVCESWSGEGNSALKRSAKLNAAKVTDAFLGDLKMVVSLVEQMARTAGPLAKDLSALYVALNEKRNKQK